MIRISNKIKTLLAMLSFVQVTSGCDATVQDIIIDTDPGVEIGNNDYYTWCKETLSVIDKDLKISGTHSYLLLSAKTQKGINIPPEAL